MDIKYFCEQFYSSHYMPVALYQNNIKVATFNSLEKDININITYSAEQDLLSANQNPSVFVSSNAGLYGGIAVNNSDYYIIIGPVFSGEITDEAVHGFMTANAILIDYKGIIEELLPSLTKYTYNQFLNLLAFLHNCINGECIDIIRHFNLNDNTAEKDLATQHTMKNLYAKEFSQQHGTYYFEMQMLSYVKTGDLDKLNTLFDEALLSKQFQEGILAENPLRQAKNLFIGLATMVGKVGAIGGGMNIEEAYNLIDLYIQECEKAQSVNIIKTLQYNLVFDFTERVAKNKLPANLSKEISLAMQFIKNHTNDQIGIDEVAEHIGKSRAYITKKFRNETGITINNYIITSKLNDAKNLLKHSDYSITEISNILCFSSQSYFQNIFKKEFGITPTQYRNKS